jgi:hypothetical protein
LAGSTADWLIVAGHCKHRSQCMVCASRLSLIQLAQTLCTAEVSMVTPRSLYSSSSHSSRRIMWTPICVATVRVCAAVRLSCS